MLKETSILIEGSAYGPACAAQVHRGASQSVEDYVRSQLDQGEDV